MPILESLSFMYDNISSQDFGIINCSIDSGLMEENFLVEREIKEVTTRGSDAPYLIETKPLPRILNLTIAFSDSFDEEKLSAVKRWLNQISYKPLIFESIPDKIFYALYEGNPKLFHTGNGQGYIQIQMRCKDQFIYSSTFLSPLYDLSTNNSSVTIQFINNGDVDCQPMLSLQKIENGNVSIINLSDGGKEFGLTSLVDNEDLYIDNENESITTSIPNTYRYDNHVGEFINMKRGVNNIQIFGKMKLQFKYQFKTL